MWVAGLGEESVHVELTIPGAGLGCIDWYGVDAMRILVKIYHRAKVELGILQSSGTVAWN